MTVGRAAPCAPCDSKIESGHCPLRCCRKMVMRMPSPWRETRQALQGGRCIVAFHTTAHVVRRSSRTPTPSPGWCADFGCSRTGGHGGPPLHRTIKTNRQRSAPLHYCSPGRTGGLFPHLKAPTKKQSRSDERLCLLYNYSASPLSSVSMLRSAET